MLTYKAAPSQTWLRPICCKVNRCPNLIQTPLILMPIWKSLSIIPGPSSP